MPQRLNVSGNYDIRVNGTTRMLIGDGATVTGPLSASGAATFTSSTVSMANLPTSDPSVAGQLWIDATAARVIKVSAG